MEETKKWIIKQWGKTWLIQLNGVETIKYPPRKKIKLDPYLTPHTRKNSRYIKD